MTNNGITAQSVNDRVDKMGKVFIEARSRIDALSELFTAHIKPNAEELSALLIQMDELQGELASYGAIKFQIEMEIIDARADVQAGKEALDDIEANYYLNVCAELDDYDKPKYTNEGQRKAALKLALANQPDAKSARSVLRAAENALARLSAQLDEVENRGKSSRSIYRGLVARLENITARMSF
jgi:formaldehyde-activating enzyme involved in methanogenesis